MEIDESYFGGKRKGKRGRGAAGKIPSFGLLKRSGKVYGLMTKDTATKTLMPVIRQKIKLDSIVYTDSYKGYDILDVSEFKHCRIAHHHELAKGSNHINGIENFWNQAKRHLRRFNGIPKEHFKLFIKEHQFRLNHPEAGKQLEMLHELAEKELV